MSEDAAKDYSSLLPHPLNRILKDFSSANKQDIYKIDRNAIYSIYNRVPVPELALYTLVHKLECCDYGTGEKLHI